MPSPAIGAKKILRGYAAIVTLRSAGDFFGYAQGFCDFPSGPRAIIYLAPLPKGGPKVGGPR